MYLGLYCLATQVYGGLLLFPNASFPGLGLLWPMRQITSWFATRVFRVSTPLIYTGNSGDTEFFWVQTAWLLVFAAIATGIWSDLDRRRAHYATLHKWFRLFVRFGLASQMFYYGMAKVIPTQFRAPSLVTLLEPVGNLTLTNLLWTSIGASTAYQMFTGWTEMLAGILLVVPRTTLAGAMVAMAAMVQVFVLNMTYDFGLKLISFHYILMSVFLMAPDLPRLATLFLSTRAVAASAEPPLFRTRRANRAAFVVQIVLALYLVGMHTRIMLGYWYAEGSDGGPQSPLYGIWNVEQLSIDGELRSPLLNDYDRRWRRVIFDVPSRMAFQRTDDSFAHYDVSIDVAASTLALTKRYSQSWKASLTFRRPSQDRLTLDGRVDNYAVRAELERVDLDSFPLLNSSFRWIRPPENVTGER